MLHRSRQNLSVVHAAVHTDGAHLLLVLPEGWEASQLQQTKEQHKPVLAITTLPKMLLGWLSCCAAADEVPATPHSTTQKYSVKHPFVPTAASVTAIRVPLSCAAAAAAAQSAAPAGPPPSPQATSQARTELQAMRGAFNSRGADVLRCRWSARAARGIAGYSQAEDSVQQQDSSRQSEYQ